MWANRFLERFIIAFMFPVSLPCNSKNGGGKKPKHTNVFFSSSLHMRSVESEKVFHLTSSETAGVSTLVYIMKPCKCDTMKNVQSTGIVVGYRK